MVNVDVLFRKRLSGVTKHRLTRLVRYVAVEEGIDQADVGVVLTGDAEIHRINRAHLAHDYPTDVITFRLSASGGPSGEIVCSVDHAVARAPEFGNPPQHELLLYVIHGVLHLVGYDDHMPDDSRRMRRRQRRLLDGFLTAEAIRPGRGRQASVGSRSC